MSWTLLYLSLWHFFLSSSPYMTLFKPCHSKCIHVGLVRPFNSSGIKGARGSECHQTEWQKLYLVKSRGSQHRYKMREEKQSRELQPMCWERLQENSKAAFLYRQDVLTGQWSEEASGSRSSFTETDFIQCCLLSPGLAHACFGWCQGKMQGRSWPSVKTVTICTLSYTNHMWQQREVFKSSFPPFNGTLAAAKGTESWGLLFCLAVLLEQYLGDAKTHFSPSYKGKRNVRREGTAGRKEKACIFFLHDHISSPHLYRL